MTVHEGRPPVPRWIIAAAILLSIVAITRMLLQQREQRHALREVGILSRSASSWSERDPALTSLESGALVAAWTAHAKDAALADHIGVRVLAAGARAWGNLTQVSLPGHLLSGAQLAASEKSGVWLVFEALAGEADEDNARAAEWDVYVVHGLIDGDRITFDTPRRLAEGNAEVGIAGKQPFVAVAREGQAGLLVFDISAPGKAPLRVAEHDLSPWSFTSCTSDGPRAIAWIAGPDAMFALSRDGATFEKPIAFAPSGGTGGFVADCTLSAGKVTIYSGVRAARSGIPAALEGIAIDESSDGGASFKRRTVVNEPGAFVLPPTVVQRADDAVLAYYAARNDAAPGAVRAMRLKPGVPEQTREVRAPILLAGKGNADLGRPRPAAVLREGRLAVGFVDNADGVSHVAFAELDF